MKRIWLLVLLALLGAGEGPVCMVTDLKGSAPVALFSMLHAGQEVAVPPGSELSLSFVQGGVRSRLKGPCRFRLAASGVEMLEGAPPTTVRPKETRVAALPTGVNLDKIGGLRRGDLHLTVDPVVMAPRFELTWASSEQFPEVEVLVEDGSLKRVLKKTVAFQPASLVVELEPGQEYQVTLTGFRADGTHVPSEPNPMKLRVLSPSEGERLRAMRVEADRALKQDPEDLAPFTELVAAYLASELYRPAEFIARGLLAKRPGDPTLEKLVEELELRHR